MKNTLYFGDNLQIMREYIEDNSKDLIYLAVDFSLDPPNPNFNPYARLIRRDNRSWYITRLTD